MNVPHCTFSLGGVTFGIPAKIAHSVAVSPTVTRVPGAPRSVKGLFALRGQIVPVLDLRGALHLAAGDAPATLLVLQGAEGLVAIDSDGVYDVIDVEESDVKPTPETLHPAIRAAVVGALVRSSRIVLLFDEQTILQATFAE